MPFYWLALGILAVWRVTHLLVHEDGPWDLIARIRHAAGPGVFGKMLDCFYCLSLWTSVGFAYLIGTGWKERAVLWPALSAGAIFIERLVSKEPAAAYFEEEENGLLRKSENGISAGDSHITRP